MKRDARLIESKKHGKLDQDVASQRMNFSPPFLNKKGGVCRENLQDMVFNITSFQ